MDELNLRYKQFLQISFLYLLLVYEYRVIYLQNSCYGLLTSS